MITNDYNWRMGNGSSLPNDNIITPYQDIAGFCKSATIEDVRKNNYILTPGRYIDFKEVAEDGIAFDEKMANLTQTLKAQMQTANELDEAIKVNLKKIGYMI
jgi:type I restriction enzyme M protein